MIRILYFASLREHLGTAGEALDLPVDVTDLAGLVQCLSQRGGPWNVLGQEAGRLPLMMARNQVAARGDTPLEDGDEVALFPPVTGG